MNGGPQQCPPCKIIICGGGAIAGSQRIIEMTNNTNALLSHWKELHPKAKMEDYQDVIDALEYAEHETEECARRIEAANNKMSGLASEDS